MELLSLLDQFYVSQIPEFISLIETGRCPQWSTVSILDSDWWSYPDAMREPLNVGRSLAYLTEYICSALMPLHHPFDRRGSNRLSAAEQRK